jgi:hypothetical protein
MEPRYHKSLQRRKEPWIAAWMLRLATASPTACDAPGAIDRAYEPSVVAGAAQARSGPSEFGF